MIDLHCHIVPGIDDGSASLDMSLDMARAFVADGVTAVACTPHILPGLYNNTGTQIREQIADLQTNIDAAGIPLQLLTGADNHVVADFANGLRSGHLLSLADTRYVLVEPPHHVLPPRLDELFFAIQLAGYVPILTHPERLTWIEGHYDLIARLVNSGVWMQLTAGSLAGNFGRQARYWAERMLDDGHAHIVATDAHDMQRRRPMLALGRELAERRVGHVEAEHLVVTRPRGIVSNDAPANLPAPAGRAIEVGHGENGTQGRGYAARDGFLGRLRRLVG